MSASDSASADAYRFVKLEKFFETYRSWPYVKDMKSWKLDLASKPVRLDLDLENSDRSPSGAQLQFIQANIVRFRFCPHKVAAGFTAQNTRSVVMDKMEYLQIALAESQPFTVEAAEDSKPNEVAHIVTRDQDGKVILSVRIENEPVVCDQCRFRMTITDLYDGDPHKLLQTDDKCLFFTPNGEHDFSIVHAIRKPATARFIGFGEQGGKSLVKNTEQVNFFNFDNMRYKQVYNQGPLDTREPLYHSDPFFVEFNGNPGTDCVYGIFIDNPAQVYVDVGYDNSRRYMLGIRFGDLDYYLIAGSNAAGVLKDFTHLVGCSRLKPRYALGYHQGCYGYENWRDVYQAVNSYRKERIPIDGIHLDVDVQHKYQTFTFDQSPENPEKFPNAVATFADLRAKGIKCSTNITPIISNRDNNYTTYTEGRDKGFFVVDTRLDDSAGQPYQNFGGGNQYPTWDPDSWNFNSGKPYIGEVYYGDHRGTTGHYPDLNHKEVRYWWGKQYQFLFDLGLEMVWQDMTTPAIRDTRGDMKGFPFRLYITDDFLSAGGEAKKNLAIRIWNLYSYNLHKATYHGLNHLRGRENKRNFIVGRGSFTGMHRFAALWTGDNASTWDFLRINVAQVLSLGMCGIAICGEDIGGFETEFPGQWWANPELLMRWTIAGAFLPWFRNHYIRKREKPWMEPVKRFQEPYAYQSVDLNNIPAEARPFYSMVLPVCRYYIERRYRLLQLLYDAMFENCLSGLPICRALILTDPQDKALYNDKASFLDNQFMVRNDLLIAPVLEPQSQANGDGRRDVYLPAEYCWYSYMDNTLPLSKAVEGGTTVRAFDARLHLDGAHIGFLLPTYVRAGAILPTIELEQYVGERNLQGQPNPVTLNVYPYPGGASEHTYKYTMYLDDGVSRSSAPLRGKDAEEHERRGGDPDAKSKYREVLITHQYTDRLSRQIKVRRVYDGYTPPLEKYFFVAVLHDPSETAAPSAIKLGGAALEFISGGTLESRAGRLADSSSSAWYYNENLRISFVKVFDQAAEIVLDVTGK
ncbi:MAG: TIM-barrel domain-containing protein [Isosphaeraceae bacterium]